MNDKHTVFICHHSDKYRNFLRVELEQAKSKIKVIGECKRHSYCIQWLAENNANADYVIIGFSNAVPDSLEIIRALCKKYPSIKLLTVSLFETEQLDGLYKSAGASHHYYSDTSTDNLIKFILE